LILEVFHLGPEPNSNIVRLNGHVAFCVLRRLLSSQFGLDISNIFLIYVAIYVWNSVKLFFKSVNKISMWPPVSNLY